MCGLLASVQSLYGDGGMKHSSTLALPLRLLLFVPAAGARWWDYAADGGAIADDPTSAIHNGVAMNRSLASLKPGDGLLVPNKTFHLMGGIVAPNLTSVTLRIDGTLAFSTDISSWPTLDGKRVLDCLLFAGGMNITITSSGVGTLNGSGAAWWGVPGIGYLVRGENRPKLIPFYGHGAFSSSASASSTHPTGIRILSTSMASRSAMWPSTRGTGGRTASSTYRH